MKRNRNPRRLHHQKRECWVNRIPVMSTSSWRWLTNTHKPVKRRFTNSGVRSKHAAIGFSARLECPAKWGRILDCAGSVPDAERVEWGRNVI